MFTLCPFCTQVKRDIVRPVGRTDIYRPWGLYICMSHHGHTKLFNLTLDLKRREIGNYRVWRRRSNAARCGAARRLWGAHDNSPDATRSIAKMILITTSGMVARWNDVIWEIFEGIGRDANTTRPLMLTAHLSTAVGHSHWPQKAWRHTQSSQSGIWPECQTAENGTPEDEV